MYHIRSFTREVVWCGAAPLLPPPPPSPPSSGLRHFASSSLTCWMCPFEFLWSHASWWLFVLLESREDHCCVWRLKRFYRLHARKKRLSWSVVLVLTCFVCSSCEPWLCSIFRCLRVVLVSVAVPLTSSLLFPQRECWVFLAASCALDSRSSLEKFRRSLMPSASLLSSGWDKDAGGFSWSNFTGLAWVEQTDHVTRSGMCDGSHFFLLYVRKIFFSMPQSEVVVV